MGFCLPGALLALFILLPDVLLVYLPPLHPAAWQRSPNPLAAVAERLGLGAGLTYLCVWRDSFLPLRRLPFFLLALLCALGYCALWLRWYRAGRDALAYYAPLGPVPLAATLAPILALGFAAAWSGALFLAVAAALFACGHLYMALHERKYLRLERAQK